jgi:hypothetical protein
VTVATIDDVVSRLFDANKNPGFSPGFFFSPLPDLISGNPSPKNSAQYFAITGPALK